MKEDSLPLRVYYKAQITNSHYYLFLFIDLMPYCY